MTISHLIIAVFVGKYSQNWPAHRGPGWASAAFVSLVLFESSQTICRDPGSLIHTAALLHVELWCDMGPSAMGDALRNLPI